jgi:DDE family transposase
MSHREELKRLNAEVSSHLGHLNKSFVQVLSLYVLGMSLVKHSGQNQIAAFLVGFLGGNLGSMKQRLRELNYETAAKRGQKRQELVVKSCFAPLLAWVLSKFQRGSRELVLAADARYLRDRFCILAVSVVVAKTAIPVAWHIQATDAKGAWNPIWFELFELLAVAIPADWQVSILTDAGLYSKPFFQELAKRRNWYPLMRITASGFFQAKGTQNWQPLQQGVFRGMQPVCLEGHCFKGNPLYATLILRWDQAYETPCLVLSNIAVQAVKHYVYALRYWIELGFKDLKRGFLHWEQTKMTDPKRAERLWLVMSISLLWLTSLGEWAADLPQWEAFVSSKTGTRLSRPLLGWLLLFSALLKQQDLPFGYFKPYAWPSFQVLNTYP